MKSLSEYLIDLLSNTKLFEMAIERHKYYDLIGNLESQIFQNWCLIRYSRLSGDSLQTIDHWKDELYAHLDNLSNIEIKGGKREKVLNQRWVKEYEYSKKPLTIRHYLIKKFIKEKFITLKNVDININFVKSMTDLSNDIPLIIQHIKNNEVLSYLNKL